MNTKAKTGGWAYPVDALQSGAAGNAMTLRDYFSAQVIAALVSGPDEALDISEGETTAQAIARHWLTEAKMAYMIADAMIAARKATS